MFSKKMLGRFFASSIIFRRGQDTLLLNDLVPHPAAQKTYLFINKYVFIFFKGPIPPILKIL